MNDDINTTRRFMQVHFSFAVAGNPRLVALELVSNATEVANSNAEQSSIALGVEAVEAEGDVAQNRVVEVAVVSVGKWAAAVGDS